MNARRPIRYRPHCPFPIEKRNPLRGRRARELEGKLFGVSSGTITHLGLFWVGNNCDVLEINGHQIVPLGIAYLISTPFALLVSSLPRISKREKHRIKAASPASPPQAQVALQ